MKYAAQILIKPHYSVYERYTDEPNLLEYFKGIFGKRRTRMIEESFSATDLISKLNLALNNVGVSNLVRITHDNTDYYLDEQGIDDDLDKIITEFGDILHNAFERFYEEIELVMESKYNQLEYLLEILILRVHPVGEFPVQINISAVPEKETLQDILSKFELYVRKIEQSVQKYINTSELTISFTKKTEPEFRELVHESEEQVKIKPNEKNKHFSLFPLYGVILGETTVDELAKIGTKSKGIDSDGKPFKYYVVNDMNFWHNGKITDQIYLTYTSPIPQQWRNCGFDWSLSYDEWIKLLKQNDFFISIVKPPEKSWYEGKRTLLAEFHASKKINNKTTLSIELYFNYSKKTSVKSKNTIYSLRVITK